MSLADRTGPLVGRHVELIPIELSFAAPLAAAAAIDRTSYSFANVPDGEQATATMIAGQIADRDRDRAVPFAHRLVESQRLVGCTRFMELRWWRGRADPDEVEIGGTWLAGDVQRTPVNTEAKLLMLTHAFEIWGVCRVAVATDERNERSRNAIARLGATFEGVIRNHRPSWVAREFGRPRNTAIFGITDVEWPTVKAGLHGRLEQPA